jgi:uncharacterized membrane protein
VHPGNWIGVGAAVIVIVVLIVMFPTGRFRR